ncbi:MAG: tyrosine--tRNA ligase [Candidatus Rokubacteria bacterium]|nr:tyrosine--tRNA ligase [Candidatus Rokubacteria bacterium]
MTVEEQLARIRRGTAEIIVEAELRQKLERSARSDVSLKVKLGLDPTAPDLHLGHTVVLQKLRDFQELGHQVIIIIGDFTGLIGDPSGRSETRKPLTRAEIEANAETYRAQLGKILDMARTRVEFNSTWLAPLRLEDLIRLTATVTVAQLLQREDFAGRYAAGRPISLHEFLYPICQAYDSVAMGADVELGGTDQTFNLLVGRDLQRAFGQDPQVAITTPILEGLDGTQKMSKSLGNYVGITEPPAEMYGKLMSLPDALMLRYFTLVTRLPEAEIREIAHGLGTGQAHPMEAKKCLARTVVEQYHGGAAAQEAEAAFVRVFQERQLPENIEEITVESESIGGDWKIEVVKAVVATGYASSHSEARRKIKEGAVDVDGKTISDPKQTLGAGKKYLIRVGKRFWKWVRVEQLESRKKDLTRG